MVKDHSDISDIIDDKIILIEGSIKIVRIDGMLDSKQIYTQEKWKNLCRFTDCIREPQNKTGLCVEHHKEQISQNINLEKIDRITTNSSRDLTKYMWSSKQKEFVLLCSVYLCPKPASRKDHKSPNYYCCKEHSTESTAVYSSHQNTVNIFNELKKDMLIRKLKDQKIKTPDKFQDVEIKDLDNEKFKQTKKIEKTEKN